MKLLPLLALGGGIYLFTKGKKSSTKTESITSKYGSKEIGYEIINCNKLVIYNQDKAFQYAFGLGAIEAINQQNQTTYHLNPDVLLMGNCFEQYESENFKTDKEKKDAQDKALVQFKKLLNTKEKAKFLYELFQWLYTGLVKSLVIESDFALSNLAKIREGLMAKALGYDVSDLIVKLKM